MRRHLAPGCSDVCTNDNHDDYHGDGRDDNGNNYIGDVDNYAGQKMYTSARDYGFVSA
jgi:hypothetical protein